MQNYTVTDESGHPLYTVTIPPALVGLPEDTVKAMIDLARAAVVTGRDPGQEGAAVEAILAACAVGRPVMRSNEDLLAKLAQYRAGNGLSDADMARKLGTTPQQFCRWMKAHVKISTAWREIIRMKLGIE